MELTLVLLLSLLLGLGLARRRPALGLLALPLGLLIGGLDGRILGLGLGLAVLIAGNMLQRQLGLPLLKLASILLAGLAANWSGFRISFITNPAGGFFYLSYLSLPLTLGWIAAVSYSLSLIESLQDRLTLRIALIAALAFLIVGLLQGQPLELALAMAVGLSGLIMSCLLRRRLVPVVWVKVPAEGLGFILALISIAGVLKTTASLALLGPLLGIGLPLSTVALPIAYGEAQRIAFLRTLRHHGLLIYSVASYLSVSLVLLTRAPTPATLLALGGTALGGMVLWHWSKALPTGFMITSGRLRLFGVPLAQLSLAETVERLELWLQLGEQAVVATPDTTALWRAQRDPRLKEIYQRADLVTPDGIGLVWASRLLGAPLPERVTGIDLIEELCHRAARQGYKIFLLGARPGVAAEAKARLEGRFPGIGIVGAHHGFFANDEEVLNRVNACSPDILLVGLGAPRQELWMLRNRRRIRAKLLLGVGGSFDVLSGRLPRAPLFLQKLGLEWLHRLMLQPWRFRRAVVIPLFFLKVLLLSLAQDSPAWTKSSSSS